MVEDTMKLYGTSWVRRVYERKGTFEPNISALKVLISS